MSKARKNIRTPRTALVEDGLLLCPKCRRLLGKPVALTGRNAGGKIGEKSWKLYDDATGEFMRVAIGDIDTSNNVHMFGFSGIVYL